MFNEICGRLLLPKASIRFFREKLRGLEMDYGKAMRILRATRNISQKDLARDADLDASYISLIETGQRAPSQEALKKISKVFSVPFYLFTLLASTAEDLEGVSESQAQELGKSLLQVLIEGERVMKP